MVLFMYYYDTSLDVLMKSILKLCQNSQAPNTGSKLATSEFEAEMMPSTQ
jgi:hypothetical protein